MVQTQPYSNTTLVKVKSTENTSHIAKTTDSNTTLVKVKLHEKV